MKLFNILWHKYELSLEREARRAKWKVRHLKQVFGGDSSGAEYNVTWHNTYRVGNSRILFYTGQIHTSDLNQSVQAVPVSVPACSI